MGACLSHPVAAVGDDEPLDLQDFPEGGKKLHPGRIQDVYRIGSTIGIGGFSKVKEATHRESGKQYACKVMPLPPAGVPSKDERELRRDTVRELDAMLGLEHPNVVTMREYFVQGGKVYLIMELMQGGQLLDRINTKGRFSEDDARTIFTQLMQAIQYLHSKGVVHRDIKMENLLLQGSGISRMKLADFGIAYKARSPEALNQMRTVCGTSHYIAPEVVSAGKRTLPDGTVQVRTYGPECDLWSAGVILYMLLSGRSPFWSDCRETLMRAICHADYSLSDPVWQHLVSAEAKDLVRQLLVADPSKRPTCAEVLAHPWMARGAPQPQAKPPTSRPAEPACSVHGSPRLQPILADASAKATPSVLLDTPSSVLSCLQ